MFSAIARAQTLYFGRLNMEPARRLRPTGSTLIGSAQSKALDVHAGAHVTRWPPPRICSSGSIRRSMRWVQGVTSRNPWIRQSMSASSKGMLCTSCRCTFSWIVALRAMA
jgi:hypothetical protein